jgi:3-oxoacyl-[acyl-carrier protein] reductase
VTDVALITGAGRGIGRAVSLELAERGFDVALLARTESELAQTASLVAALGRKAVAFPCDVARASDVDGAVARAIKTLGVPRVVVCNAGIVLRALAWEMHEAEWDSVIDINLKGTFLTARAVLPSMIARRRGRIVAISSISGTLGTAKQSAYCASKWGVIGFVKSLAEELRGTGLSALCVLPGSVDTAMLRGSGFAPQMHPEDVAKTVAWAALDAPAAMNGSAIEMFGP